MFGRQRIPKQYRAPRPTTLVSSNVHPVIRFAAVEALVIGVAVALSLVSPWTPVDDQLTARLLRLSARAEPPNSVAVLRVGPRLDALESCQARLHSALRAGHARGVIFVGPAQSLCPIASNDLPAATLGDSCLASQPARAAGFRCDDTDARALGRFGASTPRWFVPREPRSVPTFSLDDLVSARVPLEALRERVVVVEVADHAGRGALGAAAALAADLEGDARAPAPRWLIVLFAIAFAGSLGWSRRARFGRTLPLAVGWAMVTVLLSYLSARFALAGLLPLGQLLFILGISLLLVYLPQLLASRSAMQHATDLVERAALLRSDGIHTIADAEFWSRVGDLVSQAHPADSVLVAELPPRRWHLRFWPYRGLGENVIKERRRDIRRTPYASEAGTPEINVSRRFLAIEGTPVVIVPLIALGEVEGYVFLCGDAAERAYLRAPEIAERLSQDLGLMLRRRRVGGLKGEKWRRPGVLSASGPSADMVQLVESAEIALGDLRMFSSLLRNAPVGLLYADAFGHVRLLGSAFARWLPRIGVAVPSSAPGAPLSSGALMLGSLLEALAEDGSTPATLPEIGARPEGLRFEIPLPEPEEGAAKVLILTIGALVESSDGVSWTAGYVGTLVERPAALDPGEDNTVRFPLERLTEVLSVRPLAETVRSVARAAAARAGKPVQFEPPRELAHAIAYHNELSEALEDLLFDAALRDSSGKGPVVTLNEEGDRARITILDVQFGLPVSALRRALLAPSDPPEGLEAFARFAFTVAESHGSVELLEDDWGVTVIAKLMRARPLARKPSLRPNPRMRRKRKFV